jgi:hypothetical protein
VGSTNDFDDELMMLGKSEDEEGIILFSGVFHGRAHSDPIEEEEEC